MRHWLRDKHFQSLLKNSGYLAASKAVAAVAALATLAFAGRALGVAMLGMLILIHSYARALSGLSKFQSWQLIVRYGGQVLSAGQVDEFKTSTGFAFALDVVSGIGGMAVGILLLPLIGHWFGIGEQYLPLAMLYCLLLPTMAAATPVGVLRSLDRFDLLSWQGTAAPIVRAILAGWAWAAGAGLETFVAIWFVSELGGQILETAVEAGQRVSRGQLLIRIDDAGVRDTYLSARSGVTAARSAAELAERELERMTTLAEAGAVAERQDEQARSAKSVDERSDVYSLSLTLHEMLCGQKPWPGRTAPVGGPSGGPGRGPTSYPRRSAEYCGVFRYRLRKSFRKRP